MTIPFALSRGALTAYLNGVPHAVDESHPRFQDILDALRSGEIDATELEEMISIKKQIENAIEGQLFGRVTVGQDCVCYDGRPVHSYLTGRMMEILQQGFDITPWAKFMDKLYLNPSKTAVDELFLWLEKAQMPITTEGNFLAYKKVKDDFTSFHNNADGSSFLNAIGTTVSMPRYDVDDRRDNTCSTGLHFCSWHYLPSYYGSQGKVLILEINPADVVSIPSDYDNAKGRAWQYDIKGEIPQGQAEFAFAGRPIADDL